jgi:hypothetical protein
VVPPPLTRDLRAASPRSRPAQLLRTCFAIARLSRDAIVARVPECPHHALQDHRIEARRASTTSASCSS